jgi:membrane-bound lytic murein transglycosylase B
MQFLPSTWRAYGIDGDGDGHADIDDLADAVFSAANHLCANGAADPARLRSALWNYNHSKAYVDRVLEVAATV